MNNAYFVYADKKISIERFHLCTWEFKNESALIEIGCEILAKDVSDGEELIVELYIPWLKQENSFSDLYARLKNATNAKFIFNDAVINTQFIDDGRNTLGVIHQFQVRDPLCILPVVFEAKPDRQKVVIKIDLTAYQTSPHTRPNAPNVYFRFLAEPNVKFISTRKKGVSQSTIIYDVKINERRNLPDHIYIETKKKYLCNINSCFSFHIVPNSYDLTFFESSSLVNVRTLEYDSFNRYLADKRVQKDELMVVFSKKKHAESFAFFTIFTKERIGAGQFALAILVNLISGILLFIPAYRQQNKINIIDPLFWRNLPLEVYLAFAIGAILILYFIWPTIASIVRSIITSFVSNIKRKK